MKLILIFIASVLEAQILTERLKSSVAHCQQIYETCWGEFCSAPVKVSSVPSHHIEEIIADLRMVRAAALQAASPSFAPREILAALSRIQTTDRPTQELVSALKKRIKDVSQQDEDHLSDFRAEIRGDFLPDLKRALTRLASQLFFMKAFSPLEADTSPLSMAQRLAARIAGDLQNVYEDEVTMLDSPFKFLTFEFRGQRFWIDFKGARPKELRIGLTVGKSSMEDEHKRAKHLLASFEDFQSNIGLTLTESTISFTIVGSSQWLPFSYLILSRWMS